LSETPGEIKWSGPGLGEHNEEIYTEFMNFSFEKFKKLKEQGVI
jgi:crotonobetainyl-CoA:carnitine CoA-transferase CaiB-like acyl-CoA transferase